jgi:uncharacterized protein (TIGR03083 family)
MMLIMTSFADQVIAALRSGHDALAEYAAALEEKDLTGPSGAAAWDVAHVLSHLGSGAEIGLATLERALAGGGSAPEGFNQGVWDRWNAMAPLEHRDGFVAANQRLVERYESLDARTREELRIDLGFLPQPVSVAEAARMRLMEFTLHTWDVKAGADPSARLAREAVPLLLDGFAPLLGWIAKPAALDGRSADLAVELTDPESSLGLLLGDGISLDGPPGPAEPDGVLRMPTESWLRLIAGRLGPAYTPDEVRVSGPLSLEDLRRVFPGY